jgi:Tol biopolymer transport system component
MNADGTNMESIEARGGSVDWSPKNAELAYSTNDGDGANLWVRDLKTLESRSLLEKKYQQIHWGFSWSPDGEWIGFQGILPGGRSEVAVVHARGQAKGYRVLLSEENTPDLKKIDGYFSWRPDSKRFLVALKMGKDINVQLYCVDPEGKAPPQRLAGQDAAQTNFIPAWSPDGKTIVYAYAEGNRPANQKAAEKE